MRDLFAWVVLILLPVVLLWRVRHYVWQERERQILRKKYGDLPMFEEFFQRIQSERRSRKERIS